MGRHAYFQPLRVVALSCCALVLLAAGPSAAPSGGKIHHTYPQPPKVQASDPLRVFPGFDIPEHPEYYTWKVTNKNPNGKVVYQQGVPVYSLRNSPTVKGELPVGTEVKLALFRKVRGAIYYAVAAPGAEAAKPVLDPDAMTWINGLYVQAAAFNPPPAP